MAQDSSGSEPPQTLVPDRVVVEPPPVLASASGHEHHELNPLVVLRRCFRWEGLFSRSEYAVAYFGGTAITFGLWLAVLLSAALVRDVSRDGPGLPGVAALTGVYVIYMVGWLGAAIRGLNDLGRSHWWLFLAFVPFVNLGFFLWLLVVPGNPSRGPIPSTSRAAVVVGVFLIMLSLVGFATVALMRARLAGN